MDVQLVTAWQRDDSHPDPGAYRRLVRVGDVTVSVTHTGAGWPMCVQRPGFFHIGMADWEDWHGVAAVVARHRARVALDGLVADGLIERV